MPPPHYKRPYFLEDTQLEAQAAGVGQPSKIQIGRADSSDRRHRKVTVLSFGPWADHGDRVGESP